uniref:Uncharacterized protein n=1 Tax=Romanomermis culicivorax TaxID=13658 RepID=A0A915KHS5_ROMCU
MVCSPSRRENSVVQSSRVAVKVSKTNIVLLGNASCTNPWIAGRHEVGWHRHGELKILHVHGHDRFCVEADEGEATENGTKREMWRCLRFENRKHALEKGLGGDVTLTGASWQLDQATTAR